MPSELVTLAEVKRVIETDRSDDDLDALISSADAEIIRYAGPHDPATDLTVRVYAYPPRIYLPRPATSVTTIEDSYDGRTWSTRVADTYDLIYGGRVIESLSIGFKPEARVTFVPVPTNPQRAQALIQLVRLADSHNALSSERDDTYQAMFLDHDTEMTRILSTLRQNYAGGGLSA